LMAAHCICPVVSELRHLGVTNLEDHCHAGHIEGKRGLRAPLLAAIEMSTIA
jgi:hypothetical protein